MTKRELSKTIVQDLLDYDCLNTTDILELDRLMDVAADLVAHRLEDYMIIKGETLD